MSLEKEADVEEWILHFCNKQRNDRVTNGKRNSVKKATRRKEEFYGKG